MIWSTATGDTDDRSDVFVVLIHGALDRSAGLLKLSRRFDGWATVARYDRRGYGRSNPHDGPFGIPDQVDDLVQVIDRHRPAGCRRTVVVGHSYGGNVALAAVERHPGLLDAVVTYETPLSWLDWWGGSAGSEAMEWRHDPEEAAERFMRRLIGDERWERLPEATRRARRAEGPAMVAELAELRERPAWDAAAIDVPVLALYGEHGRPHHRRGAETIAEWVADARVDVIAGAHHFGPNTHPDEVAARVRAFVDEVDPMSTRSERATTPSDRRYPADMADDEGTSQPISMSASGPPRTVLPAEPAAVTDALAAASASDDPVAAVRALLAEHPASLLGWSTLGGLEDDLTIRYACYRVGYHRGLDTLRANGWRGSGDVPWSEPTNRGFLRSLLGLHAVSRAIGDDAEGDRTAQFLLQLDRRGVPQDEMEAIAGPSS